MIQIASNQLKALEELVKDAAQRLKALAAEKAKLASEAARLREENAALREQTRKLAATAARQQRLRVKLGKIADKLERIG